MEHLIFPEFDNNKLPIYKNKISLCAWCNSIMDIVPIIASSDLVSHGICNKCKEKHITNNYFEKL